LKSPGYFNGKRLNPGLSISYLQGITNNIDIAATLAGSVLSYPVPDKNIPKNIQEGLIDLNAVGHFKLLSDKYILNPFLIAGVGASKWKGYFGAYIPLGVGLQVKLVPDVFLMATTQYRVPVTDNVAYHLNHSVGVVAPIKERQAPAPVVVPPPPPPVVTDRDGDGVLDADDACPDVPGLASLKGCPDSDGDGIADADDKCPTVPGLVKYAGCPIPDTDGDGINDEQDKCPTQKGVARYQGCPVPDSDGDGVNDEEDKCKDVPGPADNAGCPKLESYNFKAENVQFLTGSAKLTPNAMKELDNLTKILNDYPKLNINIDGHTDNTGKAESNLALSQKRADAVKAYMVSKGISADRLTATGYGQTQPVADNATAEGRTKNRRVAFSARQ
jgi:outer membrane protein OmpA-like peptidoglycan-associated protein